MLAAALFIVDLALFARAEPPELVLSGEPLPPGAVARFGIPHEPRSRPQSPFAGAFAEDASFRLAVGEGKDVRVWAWHPPGLRPPKHHYTGHAADVTRVALSPDGRAMATADKDGGVRVWHLVTGETLLTIRTDADVRYPHQIRPTLAVSSRGKYVFIPGKTGFVVWDTVAGKRGEVLGADRSFVAAGFSPDGTQLATADSKGKADCSPGSSARAGNR